MIKCYFLQCCMIHSLFHSLRMNDAIHFFQTDFQTTTSTSVWLAVNEDGISVLDYSTMQPSRRFTYDSIATFGGCQDDFMMVVITPESEEGADGRRLRLSEENSDTQRILFRTKKPEVYIHVTQVGHLYIWTRLLRSEAGDIENCSSNVLYAEKCLLQILQITLLIADYMNLIGKTTAASGSGGGGRSSLFLGAPASLVMTPKLPRCASSGAGSVMGSSRAQELANPRASEDGAEASTAKRKQLDSGVA